MSRNSVLDEDMALWQWIWRAEEAIDDRLRAIERLVDINQAKVLRAFAQAKISGEHLFGSTGYGYDDRGREQLDVLFAAVFGGQDALVSAQFASGTHALCVALFALLRPGQRLLYASGAPYDTLWPVIGLRDGGPGSLREFGIDCSIVDLLPTGGIDIAEVARHVQEHPETSVVAVQRSAGYAWRRGLSVREIGELTRAVKLIRPDIRVMVDNCYGEFTEPTEPPQVGVDLTVGSLIKNPGGGLATTGGYLVGTTECVAAAANRLTAPGIGRECGSSESHRLLYQGLFLAPRTVGEALKGSLFAASVLDSCGIVCAPRVDEPRTDVVLRLMLGSAERLLGFCQAIQSASPIDAHVRPEAATLPGYAHPVVMAAGTFIQGASIELSADGPLREPYIGYLQGGLTYAHVKWAVARAIHTLGWEETCLPEGGIKPYTSMTDR